MTSLFQGMLTNTVYLYQLNEKLTDALEEENDPAYYFWFGRILRTILIVDPLRKDQFQDEITERDYTIDEYDYDRDTAGLIDNSIGFSEKLLSQVKRLKSGYPPQYFSAEEMTQNYYLKFVYMGLFFIEGFGRHFIGFASTYPATQCSELTWGIAYNVWASMIP